MQVFQLSFKGKTHSNCSYFQDSQIYNIANDEESGKDFLNEKALIALKVFNLYFESIISLNAQVS